MLGMAAERLAIRLCCGAQQPRAAVEPELQLRAAERNTVILRETARSLAKSTLHIS
jgi:hypothetical protein